MCTLSLSSLFFLSLAVGFGGARAGGGSRVFVPSLCGVAVLVSVPLLAPCASVSVLSLSLSFSLFLSLSLFLFCRSFECVVCEGYNHMLVGLGVFVL